MISHSTDTESLPGFGKPLGLLRLLNSLLTISECFGSSVGSSNCVREAVNGVLISKLSENESHFLSSSRFCGLLPKNSIRHTFYLKRKKRQLQAASFSLSDDEFRNLAKNHRKS